MPVPQVVVNSGGIVRVIGLVILVLAILMIVKVLPLDEYTVGGLFALIGVAFLL